MREEGRERRFTDSAFTGEDENLVPDLRKALGDDGDVGVGAFGRCRTDVLIGTAGAGVAFASLFGFRSRTVFCSLSANV